MASRISRKEWVRGLPSAFGVGKYDRKRAHSASERSVGYGFLIRESVRNHPNPHPYQTGSKISPMRASLLRAHQTTAEVKRPWSNEIPIRKIRKRRSEAQDRGKVPKR